MVKNKPKGTSHFIRGLDEFHERGVPRCERENILPEAMVVAEVPLELGLREPAHDGRHFDGVRKFAYHLRGKERRKIPVGFKAETKNQEQGYRLAVRYIYRDNRESDRRELGTGEEMWDR